MGAADERVRDYVARKGGLKAQLHGNRQQLREPRLDQSVEFDFELGDIKFNRSGQTVVQIIVPYEYRDVNLVLQDAVGLILHAEVTKVGLPDVQSL